MIFVYFSETRACSLLIEDGLDALEKGMVALGGRGCAYLYLYISIYLSMDRYRYLYLCPQISIDLQTFLSMYLSQEKIMYIYIDR